MKTNINVGVIGSWRKLDPDYKFSKTKEDFYSFCFNLGLQLAQSDSVRKLVVSISNDYLEIQALPVRKDGLVVDTTYSYKDTADYIVMLGFLFGNKDVSKKRVQLFISEHMISGCLSEFNTKILPFFDQSFFLPGSNDPINLKQYKDIIEIKYIDEKHVQSLREKQKRNGASDEQIKNVWSTRRRSNILQDYVAPQINFLITVGGGTATKILYNAVKYKEIERLYLPYFKARSLLYFCRAYKNNYAVFGKPYKEIFNDVDEMDIDFICDLEESEEDRLDDADPSGIYYNKRFSWCDDNISVINRDVSSVLNSLFHMNSTLSNDTASIKEKSTNTPLIKNIININTKSGQKESPNGWDKVIIWAKRFGAIKVIVVGLFLTAGGIMSFKKYFNLETTQKVVFRDFSTGNELPASGKKTIRIIDNNDSIDYDIVNGETSSAISSHSLDNVYMVDNQLRARAVIKTTDSIISIWIDKDAL